MLTVTLHDHEALVKPTAGGSKAAFGKVGIRYGAQDTPDDLKKMICATAGVAPELQPAMRLIARRPLVLLKEDSSVLGAMNFTLSYSTHGFDGKVEHTERSSSATGRAGRSLWMCCPMAAWSYFKG